MYNLVYAKPLARLIEEFQKLPGVGPKLAERLALHVLKQPSTYAHNLSNSIIEAKEKVNFCQKCFNFTDDEICEICKDSKRDISTICIVSETKDLIALEKTKEYKGSYHVLQGLISPMEGIGPEKLRIKEFLKRINYQEDTLKEIILAINPSVEGEATTLYIGRLIKPLDIKLTRIACGLPIGGDLEYADSMTLAKALEGRTEI